MMASLCWFESHPFPLEDETISLLAATCDPCSAPWALVSVRVLRLPPGSSTHSAAVLIGT